MKKSIAIPKVLGACADLLYRLRQDRLKAQKRLDELASREAQLKDHLIQQLPKSKATGVAGRVARALVTMRDVPDVRDWPALQTHIMRTGSFELLQRRLASQAVVERWEEGREVPGVGRFRLVTVSVTRL